MTESYGADIVLAVKIESRVAASSELQVVLSILDEAGAWLHSIGVTRQWPASFSEDAALVGMVRGFVEDGSFHLVIVDGEVAGCFCLDDVHQQAWPEDDDALNLHKLAVLRRFASMGVARAVLDWAFKETGGRGKAELRLDCRAGNERLKRYYADAGFESQGDVELTGSLPDGSVTVYQASRFARRTDRPSL